MKVLGNVLEKFEFEKRYKYQKGDLYETNKFGVFNNFLYKIRTFIQIHPP